MPIGRFLRDGGSAFLIHGGYSMDPNMLFNSEIALSLFIFFARIIDVSIGTIRIILVSRGYRALAPVFGFFEVLVWLLAIRQILGNLELSHNLFVYAAGFATGNYVGMILESKIAIGYQSVRIMTTEKVMSLPLVLREEGFGATVIKGRGARGEVSVIYTIVPRRGVDRVLEIVDMFEPRAFVSIEDVKSKYSGYFSDRGRFPALFGRLTDKFK